MFVTKRKVRCIDCKEEWMSMMQHPKCPKCDKTVPVVEVSDEPGSRDESSPPEPPERTIPGGSTLRESDGKQVEVPKENPPVDPPETLGEPESAGELEAALIAAEERASKERAEKRAIDNLDDNFYNWAFGYTKANCPGNRMENRWNGLHKQPWTGLKEAKEIYDKER